MQLQGLSGLVFLIRMEFGHMQPICVSRHFEFGSGHTQEGTCQRALHQFIFVHGSNVVVWILCNQLI